MSPLFVVAALLCSFSPEPLALDLRMDAGPSSPGVAFVDVGQGASMVAVAPGGEVIVVDSGPASGVAALLDVLVWTARRRVSLWIHTHFDSDHIGAFTLALRGPDDRAGTSDDLIVDEAWERGAASVPEHDAAVAYADWSADFEGPLRSHPGSSWSVPGAWFGLSSRGPADSPAENELGLAVCARVGGLRIFIQGDLPGALALGAARNCGAVDLWWLGHHGSDDAIDPGSHIVEALDPGLVVISAGQGNGYCHPSFTTLQRLEERRVAILGLPAAEDASHCAYEARSWSQRHELMPQGVWVEAREEGAIEAHTRPIGR